MHTAAIQLMTLATPAPGYLAGYPGYLAGRTLGRPPHSRRRPRTWKQHTLGQYLASRSGRVAS
eukprot:1762219-Rhodomonas_salina.1